jgi:serine/threonine-protein kinase
MELERRIGTVLRGKWTLERLLGSGGMAAVYAGLHKIGRRDAIKIVHPEIAREPELRARFDQEAYAVNRFAHPGAVEIRDIDVTEDGCPFLVMELLEGESLAARCRRLGAPTIEETLRIAEDVLDVLAAAHAQGIIHRDIKPDNLFYLPDGRIKVLDFGVARVRQAAQQLRTKTGATLGTVTYMPPEQVKGMDIDARADVFAVGATMFRLIAQRRIHEGRSDAELLVKMATQPAPPLASVAPHAPASVCAIVDRALAFDREARYPSAKAMQHDVRAVRAGRPIALVPVPAHVQEATRIEGRGALSMPAPVPVPAAPLPPAAIPQVAVHQVAQPSPTRFAAQPTQFTLTTLGEKRLRWAALALPVLGAGVLAIVFYRATHVERAAARDATEAADSASAAQSARAAQPASEARLPLLAQPSDATEPAEPSDPAEPEPSEAESTDPAAAPPPARLNCFLTNDCSEVCNDDHCHIKCKNRSGCTVGAVHGAEVHCSGPGPCQVSCAGKCEVKCDRACIVQCTPGFECEIEDCKGQVETCAPFLLACGSACPQ